VSSDKPRRVRQILELALSLPAGERATRLAEACDGDSDLQHEIESLIDLYERSPLDATQSSPLSSPTTFSPDLAPEHPVAPITPNTRPSTGAGTSWGGFVLLEELGRGGFGVVHRAWDATLKRDVALKIIDVHRLHGISEDTVLREGQLMARVRHPNVVTVYSAQRIGGEVGLTMEYIKGRTLSMLVAEDGPLGAHEAALIGMSVCDALTAVHRLGLVHRDLKASNVMREHGGRIVLMDFGAGRELAAAADGRAQVLGTPVYMAPEVLLGSRGTAGSDLYSLGVLLYNLVTAQYPIQGARMDQIRLAHLSGERVPLVERRPELPSPFVEAVEKMLSPNPEDRPPTSVAAKRLLSDAMPYLPPDSGGRKRRRTAGARASTRTPSAPLAQAAPAVRVNPLTILGCVVAGALALATALGFVTTVEFNTALGRTGDFAADPLVDYPVLGVRSVFGSIVYVLLAFVLLYVALALVRGIARAVPAVGRLRAAVGERLQQLTTRVGLDSPAALSQALPVAGLLGLALVVWRFRPFLIALLGDVDRGSAADLGMLGIQNEHMQLMFRRSTELVIVLLTIGVVAVIRQRLAGRAVRLAPVAATFVVIGIALVLLVLPWRLVFHAEFEQATLDGRSCFVIGETASQLLVHCPTSPPPRNTVLPRGDHRVQFSSRISNLFDAYAPGGASR
jgi:serine/threonine protein kinase